MGGGKGSPSAPPPIDPGKSMGEYLFGQGFATQYQGITDPRLQERLIGAEATYRPQYTALELADIGVMARGLDEREVADPRYAQAQDRISKLQAELARTPGTISETRKAGLHGRNRSWTKTVSVPNPKRAELEREIASQQKRLSGLSPTKMQMATPGLFDLLEEQSRRAGDLQRSEAERQRESDVGALQEYAPQVVDAYRQADPYSTQLADMASARASEDLGLASKGKEMMRAKIQGASKAEKKLLESGAKLSDLSPTQQESILRKSGIELSDLSPTEQEALLNKRGTEFLESTGELTALEKRRIEQQSRAGSLSRGREMDQGGLYDEVQSRMAEELNKRDREIALGSGLFNQGAAMRNQRIGLGASLLGQEAGMSQSRMGLGGQFLGAGESLAAQRRAEQMQKQQFGAGLIGQEAAIRGQLLGQAFGMQRGMAGDVGMTLLGRPTQSIGLGGQMLGQAQAGAAGPMGPQLFDPNVGINMALQQRGQDVTFQGMQAQAKAAGQAGTMEAAGSVAAAALPLMFCWVAREVYGIENPKWLEFREWMLNDSPSWFRKLYIKFGARFATFISNKPRIKSFIRKWMDTKIK